jgi:uncharacterized phage protein (TIGR02218 family)
VRTAPDLLKAWLVLNNVCHRADLITITLQDAVTVYRWTTSDLPLTIGGVTWGAMGGGAPLVKRGSFTQSSGLAVDTLDLTLNGVGFSIGGKSLGLLGAQGYFDGATVVVDHLIMPAPGDVSLGTIPSFFSGQVANVQPRGVNLVMRLKSGLERLNVQLPRFLLGPRCGNAVYDAGCTLLRATWTFTGTVIAANIATIYAGGASIYDKPDGFYNGGILTFTSGVLTGKQYGIQTSIYTGALVGPVSGVALNVQLPLSTMPAVGDTFSIYPGCDRSQTRCTGTFGNVANFRGYPYIPGPESGS